MKNKSMPCIVTSREAMENVVSEIVRLKLDYAQAQTEMEQEIAAVQRKHQARLSNLVREIATKEGGAFIWCQTNKQAFGARKSIDFLQATVGFRTTPPRVEKVLPRERWSAIAHRLERLEWGKKYVSYADPAPNKERLLADREKLTEQQLAQAGIQFDQYENFFIEPKSEVLEQSVREAA